MHIRFTNPESKGGYPTFYPRLPLRVSSYSPCIKYSFQ